jgi:hypothetical protein
MKPSRVPSAAKTSVSEPGLRSLSDDRGSAEDAVRNTQPPAAAPASPPQSSTTRNASRTYLPGPAPRRRRLMRAEWLKGEPPSLVR